ncbi:MAG: Hsp20/alpha crystallin family protein [Planctomycetes bacterium]|nr:Hsp20/alpha crystallin family protein [Planctomycetota bacterium]
MVERDPNEWMWERAAELLERADKAQRRFFHLQQDARRACWEPPIDVFESAHEIAILIALPGVRAEDIEITLERASLVIAARRTLPEAFSAAEVRRLEIPQGRFERRIPLAPGSYEILERRVVDGCLCLRLGKVP